MGTATLIFRFRASKNKEIAEKEEKKIKQMFVENHFSRLTYKCHFILIKKLSWIRSVFLALFVFLIYYSTLFSLFLPVVFLPTVLNRCCWACQLPFEPRPHHHLEQLHLQRVQDLERPCCRLHRPFHPLGCPAIGH